MNWMLILEGCIEIVLSLITGLLVFFLSMKVFMLLTRRVDELEELKRNNTAVGFVLAVFILALMLIVNASVSPAMDTLKSLFSQESPALAKVLVDLARVVVIYLVSGLVAVIVLWLAIALYSGLTRKIDELGELRSNNLAVGIVFGTFIFSAGFIVIEPLKTLLNAFLPPHEVASAHDELISINSARLIEGVIELPLALLGMVVVFLLGVKLSDLLTGKIDETAELKKNNVASAIYTASSLWSLMYLVKEAALQPLYPALSRALSDRANPGTLAVIIVLIPVFFVVTAGLTLLLIRLAQGVFMALTKKIDEMAELRNNNVAVALIMAVLTVSIVILVTHGMNVLAQGFIPLPQAAKGGGFTAPTFK